MFRYMPYQYIRHVDMNQPLSLLAHFANDKSLENEEEDEEGRRFEDCGGCALTRTFANMGA